jgi:hypothetical protein
VIGSRRLGLDDALAEEGTLPGDSGVEDLCQAPANDVCVSTTERGAGGLDRRQPVGERWGLKLVEPTLSISHESIYRFIHS